MIEGKVREWLDSEGLASAQSLNEGLCADFANALAHLPGVTVCGIYDVEDAGDFGIGDIEFLEAVDRGTIGHTFVQYEARYFDAECPAGVSCPTSLPIFQRARAELAEQLAIEPADDHNEHLERTND